MADTVEGVAQKIAEIEEKAKKLEGKIERVELLPKDDPDRQVLVALRQELVALRQELVELRKEKNLRLAEGVAGAAGAAGDAANVQPGAGAILRKLDKIQHILEQEVAALYFRPISSSQARSSVYRVACMTAYKWANIEPQQQRCLLTGKVFPEGQVKAAHIFRHEWIDRRALVHADLDIDGPENVIPCYQTVEKALDQMRITIEPTAPEPPTFTVRVLDPKLLELGQWIVHTDDLKMSWSALNGKEIDFTGLPDEANPPLSSVVCALHMRAALKWAVKVGWIGEGEFHVPQWAQQLVSNPAAGLAERFLRSAVQSASTSSNEDVEP